MSYSDADYGYAKELRKAIGNKTREEEKTKDLANKLKTLGEASIETNTREIRHS